MYLKWSTGDCYCMRQPRSVILGGWTCRSKVLSWFVKGRGVSSLLFRGMFLEVSVIGTERIDTAGGSIEALLCDTKLCLLCSHGYWGITLWHTAVFTFFPMVTEALLCDTQLCLLCSHGYWGITLWHTAAFTVFPWLQRHYSVTHSCVYCVPMVTDALLCDTQLCLLCSHGYWGITLWHTAVFTVFPWLLRHYSVTHSCVYCVPMVTEALLCD
jgi:hypothetical protein